MNWAEGLRFYVKLKIYSLYYNTVQFMLTIFKPLFNCDSNETAIHTLITQSFNVESENEPFKDNQTLSPQLSSLSSIASCHSSFFITLLIYICDVPREKDAIKLQVFPRGSCKIPATFPHFPGTFPKAPTTFMHFFHNFPWSSCNTSWIPKCVLFRQ